MQLWGEAALWWQQNPQGFRLTRDEREALAIANSQFREMLTGEEEIRQTLGWDIPVEEWGDFTPMELRTRLFYGDHITVQQVGRVLAKLAREDKRLTFTEQRRIKTYRLPIQKFCITNV